MNLESVVDSLSKYVLHVKGTSKITKVARKPWPLSLGSYVVDHGLYRVIDRLVI